DRALDGLGQVGVGIDDQRVLTAELERHLLEAVRRAACARAAALDTAYERHDRDQRVRGERFTAFATTAQQIDHARRDDAVDELHHAIGRDRRLRRRLDDERVAG